MNYGQTDKAREIQIKVAAGSASTGGKRGESTIEERILSTVAVSWVSLLQIRRELPDLVAQILYFLTTYQLF
jgi:hypothetical protein